MMMNTKETNDRYDRYVRQGDKSLVLSKGLPQVYLKGLMPILYPQDGKGAQELIPENTTWENSSYVRYQHESKSKVKMSRQKQRRQKGCPCSHPQT